MKHLRVLRFLAILLALLAAVAAGSRTAHAHAGLVRSEPADGVTLASAPGEFHLWFNEDIVPSFSAVEVLDAHGTNVPGASVRPDPDAPAGLLVELPTLPAGAYTLLWKTLSQADGHPSQGMVLFGVQTAAPTAPVRAAGAAAVPWIDSAASGSTTRAWQAWGGAGGRLYLYRGRPSCDEQARRRAGNQHVGARRAAYVQTGALVRSCRAAGRVRAAAAAGGQLGRGRTGGWTGGRTGR